MYIIEFPANHSPRTIAFLVKKAAQFDVPLFQFISQSKNSRWRFVVIYLESPEVVNYDIELKTRSDWGIDLTRGYEWYWLGISPGTESIQDLFVLLKIDVLITNGYKFNFAPFLEVAKGLNIPMGLRIDSVMTGHRGPQLLLRKLLMRRRYKDFKGFFTTGKLGYAYLHYIGIDPKLHFWFPYCIDNNFFALKTSGQQLKDISFLPLLPVRLKVVLGICKFNERENPMELLRAFCLLADPSLHLIMIGDGPLMTQLKSYAAGFPTLSIHFTGYVPYLQLPAWYHLAGLFVHTALNEPWGVSVQEALAAGCRVVASDRVGSAYDLIRTGENGFIYPVKAEKTLAGLILKALSLPQQAFDVATRELLSEKWNYAVVWDELQLAAAQMTSGDKPGK